MLLEEYQKLTKTTAIYPTEPNLALPYLINGLISEFGELTELIDKEWKDNDFNITTNPRKEITKKMGDILWYIARILDELDVSLSYFVTLAFETLIDDEDEQDIKDSLLLGAEEIDSFDDIYKFCHEDMAYKICIGNVQNTFAQTIQKSILCGFYQCSKVSGIIKKIVCDKTTLESIQSSITTNLTKVFLTFLQIAFLYNISLEHIAEVNCVKLSSRKEKENE